MRTEDLVASLAADVRPIRDGAVERWLAGALVAGGVVSLSILVAWLGLRPMHEAMAAPSFWMKAAYTLAVAGAGWVLARRLARPAGAVGAARYLMLAPVAILGVVGVAQLVAAGPDHAIGLLLGSTWTLCPFRILALSTPVMLALILGLRRLAPTRARMAGAAAGLLAGGLGATAYGLYCQETSAAFVAVWYTLGIGLSGLIGVVAGSRLLRW